MYTSLIQKLTVAPPAPQSGFGTDAASLGISSLMLHGSTALATPRREAFHHPLTIGG